MMMALYSFAVCCAHLMSILHSFRRSPAEVQVAFTVSSEVIKKCEACDVSVFLSVLTKTDRICLLTVVSTSFLPRSRRCGWPRSSRLHSAYHQRREPFIVRGTLPARPNSIGIDSSTTRQPGGLHSVRIIQLDCNKHM